MNEWFIIQKSEHIGPLSEKSLHEEVQNNWTFDVLVWNETLKNPKTYRSIFFNGSTNHRDTENVETPPPLPFKERSNETLMGDLEAELMSGPKSQSSPQEVKKEDKKESRREELSSAAVSTKRKFSPILILAILASIVATGGWLKYQEEIAVFKRVKGMSLTQFEQLNEVAKLSVEEKKFVFVLSQDKQTIWGAVNSKLRGSLHLNFASLPRQSLGRKVTFSAQGQLANGLIELGDFKFKSGTKLVDGLYKIEVVANENLRNSTLISYINPEQTEFGYEGEYFVSSISRLLFDRELKKYREKKKKNNDHFYIELKEKYRTVSVITNQIKDALGSVFNAEKDVWSQSLALFENNYKRRFGVFFTSFVTANEESYLPLMKKNFEDKYEIISHYSELSKIAKSIGNISMSAMEGLSKFKTKAEVDNSSLKNETFSELIKIIQDCEKKIDFFEKSEEL